MDRIGKPVTAIEFSNRFTKNLPGDRQSANSPRQVYQSAWTAVAPAPVRSPTLLAFNASLADTTGFSSLVDVQDQHRVAQILSGNEVLPESKPFAMVYGGHQFGHWAGQLGDGRAINLFELRNKRVEHWSFQLKGAGPTPLSRHADGRAVLRSSMREYLCSEAMFALGVPTTRALSLVQTGERVVRDMFYDGNPQSEPGAIVCRVSPSFIRFGNLELPAARGDIELLRQLLEFVIRTDRPDLGQRLDNKLSDWADVVLDWFQQVCRLTQHMVVAWMRVGFVHGVMNTDNMSVLGLTIDYGPYGWIDDYDPDWTPNTTDAQHRRYRFGQQAAIARWNLYQLANAIYPVVGDAAALEAVLAALPAEYDQLYREMMCQKLGVDPQLNAAGKLITELESVLTRQSVDMTLFFRRLSKYDGLSEDNQSLITCLQDALYNPAGLESQGLEQWQNWFGAYRSLIAASADREARRHLMLRVNPAYVPRNYLSQMAIEAMQSGDSEPFRSLLTVLSRPYDEQPDAWQRFGGKRPDWALDKAGCSMLSCSS